MILFYKQLKKLVVHELLYAFLVKESYFSTGSLMKFRIQYYRIFIHY